MQKYLLPLVAVVSLATAPQAKGADDDSWALRPYIGVKAQHSMFRGSATTTGYDPEVGGVRDWKNENTRQNPNGVAVSLGLEHEDIPLRVEFEWLFNEKIVDDNLVAGKSTTRSDIMMFNVFYDLETNSQFTPYIGFGVGKLNLSYDFQMNPWDARDESIESWVHAEYDNTRIKANTGFAMQVMLGTSIGITKGFALDLGYKYATFGNTGADLGVNYTFTPDDVSIDKYAVPYQVRMKDENIASHAFYFGGRYVF